MSSNVITDQLSNRELLARVPTPGLTYVVRFCYLLVRTRLAVLLRRRRRRGSPLEIAKALLPETDATQRLESGELALDRYEVRKAGDLHAFTVHRHQQPARDVVLKYGKRLAPELHAFMHAANQGHLREVLFYQRLAPHLCVRTAPLIGAQSDSLTGDYELLLGRVHGSLRPDHRGVSPAEAHAALEALGALHSTPLARLPSLDWIVGSTNDRPFRWLIIFFKERFDDRFIRVFGALCDYLNTLDPCLVHLDYRPGNLIFHETDATTGTQVTILDWAGVSISAGVFDVVYFLTLGLDPRYRRDAYAELTQRYLSAMSGRSSPCERTRFDRDFQVVSLLFAMACHGYAQVELFVDWNVDDAQWSNWKYKIRTALDDLDLGRVAAATGCTREDLTHVAADLAL